MTPGTSRSPLAIFALLAMLAGAGCRHDSSLDGNWGIPAQEGPGHALSREIVLVADNQFQHLYGEPVWLRTGFTNRFVSVAIRAVQLDFYAQDLLAWIIDNYGDKRLVVHLGDALNVACSAEWDTFLAVMGNARQGWVMAPGNHDMFYFGNGHFATDEWTRACTTADGQGTPFFKHRFVEAYLTTLAAQTAQGAPGFFFQLPTPLPDEGRWTAPPGRNAVVTGLAWRIDSNHPWRSFVAQRLDLRLPGASEPVTAILIDTSQYLLRPGLLPLSPWHNAGITGSLLNDQIEIVQQWLAQEPSGTVKLLLGHHPYDTLTRHARAKIDAWRTRSGLDLYVSAHTHTAHYIVHKQEPETWLELNIGSTTDWPPEFRTLAASSDARFADRVAFRFQRYPLHRLWDAMQIPDCDPAWEVPPERADFYVAYDQLTTPNSAETQRALMDTLLVSHRWRLGFVSSSSSNTVWPSGMISDAAVVAAIDQQLTSADIEAKLHLLRQLESFERERVADDPLIQKEFHLCQAKWASRYDLEGRRVPDVDDAYVVIPKE